MTTAYGDDPRNEVPDEGPPDYFQGHGIDPDADDSRFTYGSGDWDQPDLDEPQPYEPYEDWRADAAADRRDEIARDLRDHGFRVVP